MKKDLYLLLIDDDYDDQELFKDAVDLIDDSIKCTCIDNGEKALMYLRDKRTEVPDFIFLDLNMPRINGQQFLKQVKNERRLQNIPIVIYTTTGVKEVVDEVKMLGAMEFIIKPSSFDEIVKEIAEVLKKYDVSEAEKALHHHH